MNEVVKPIAAGKCKFPIPTELITVMLFMALSHSLNLGELNYNVKEVGKVFVGIPKPELPPFELLCLVAIDSIPISIVSYSIAMKIYTNFCKKRILYS
ncbi:hypothetical protein PVAND_013339 [Polypedilum vanderplanki]|uniref:Uncharacterized protein n=1 Tax=Polypedilum vanderplanki TaxID=319348 RepID=A0A9J6CP69_POLVA|nr:hypothetical protein PVAND_013339 [Polypedilum vanderplanki]